MKRRQPTIWRAGSDEKEAILWSLQLASNHVKAPYYNFHDGKAAMRKALAIAHVIKNKMLINLDFVK